MYLLPDEIELEELKGQQINQICIGPYDAQVVFEKGVVVQSFHKLEGKVSGMRKLWFDGKWIDTSDVLRAPKQAVVAIVRESDLIFKIQLTGDVALYFHTEESPYESINIRRPSGSIDVI